MLFVKKRFFWVMVILLVTGSDLFFWSTGNMPYRSITLPLLIPLFFGFFWSTLIVNRSLSLALFCCWIGDWFLLYDTNHLLQIMSVSSYLLAQFLFIETLFKQIKSFAPRAFIMGMLFFGAYLIVFFSHIFAYLEDMKFIGLAYGFILSFLGCLSIMHFFQYQTWHRFSLFLGILLFSGRDVMLTYNKYFFHEDYFIVGIVVFYSTALFLILNYFQKSKVFTSFEE